MSVKIDLKAASVSVLDGGTDQSALPKSKGKNTAPPPTNHRFHLEEEREQMKKEIKTKQKHSF